MSVQPSTDATIDGASVAPSRPRTVDSEVQTIPIEAADAYAGPSYVNMGVCEYSIPFLYPRARVKQLLPMWKQCKE